MDELNEFVRRVNIYKSHKHTDGITYHGGAAHTTRTSTTQGLIDFYRVLEVGNFVYSFNDCYETKLSKLDTRLEEYYPRLDSDHFVNFNIDCSERERDIITGIINHDPQMSETISNIRHLLANVEYWEDFKTRLAFLEFGCSFYINDDIHSSAIVKVF